MINLKERDGKCYISFFQLRKMGFDYPEKGTPVFTILGFYALEDNERHLRFHEKREGWPGVYLSPHLSDIGKVYRDNDVVYLELTPNLFQYKPINQ